MRHPDETRLNDYVDGRLAPSEAQAIEGHLDACQACRARADSLAELNARLERLPREIPPRRDVRPDPATATSRRRWDRLRDAAVLAAMLASGAALWFLLPGGEPPVASVDPAASVDPVVAAYARAADELSVRLRDRGSDLSPAAARAVQANLTVVDAAIRELQRAGSDDPELRRHLETRYRLKLDLLRDALALLEET